MKQSSFIIKPEQLLEDLKQEDIVVIDCRFNLQDRDWGYRQYINSHIPNAYYLDLEKNLSAPIKNHGGRHPLPINFPETLGKLGIVAGKSRIVAYDDSRFAFAARLWWLARYWGHEQVQILDGGWQAWQELGYPIENKIPRPRKSCLFESKPNLDWTIEHSQLQEHLNSQGVILIDSRDQKRYLGQSEPIDPIAGHIPGAINHPYLRVSDEQGYLLEDQKDLWQDIPDSNKEIWVYCGSGVTACVNLFSLEQAGLFKRAKLYPGGWSDWCSYLVNN
jgi:thiosulfate/3-mercaptopyruvate sulfurtransferase